MKPMFRHAIRPRAALLAACALLAALFAATAALPGTTPVGHAAPASQTGPLQDEPTETPEPQEGITPCDTKGRHSIEPRIVEEGEQVTVKVEYDFNCSSDGTRQVDLMYVLENNGMLKLVGESPGQSLLNNLKDGMQRLALAVDWRNESRVGMIWYGCNWQGIVPIGSGSQHYDLWLRQINAIRGQVPGGANPATSLRAASSDLNNLAKDPDNPVPGVMILIDAGSPGCQGAPPPQEAGLEQACNAAKAEGNVLALVSLEAAQGRLRGCNSRGWYWRSGREDGSDLPAIFEQIRDQLLFSKRPSETHYNDFLQTAYFEYVFGSGIPRDADNIFFNSDLTWEEPVPQNPVGAYQYEYKVQTLVGSGGAVSPITIAPGPQITLYYADGASNRVLLENQDVCIYRSGRREQDCGPFEASLTATAVASAATPTPDVTPTLTPDVPDPTETPETPDPTATPEEPDPTETPVEPDPTETPTGPVSTPIYLPMSLADAKLTDG